MLLSEKWLKEFVDIDISPREYAEGMSLSGSKVEGFIDRRGGMSGVIAGRVLAVEPHPNADRLKVCEVDVGKTLTIVTAAANVTPGCLVPVASDGAVLPGGTVIKAGDMRGIVSEGMMCSIKELGLTLNDMPYADEDGILLIDESDCAGGVKPGDDICGALMLDDLTYEFEITPNRPDCLSVRGLARETAATFSKQLKLPEPQLRGGGGEARLRVSIADPGLCPRYSAMMIKDVKIGPSPLWLRMRLRASGVRPINNIVDITNYVMLEYGQPMHAFDYDCLEGAEIVVRTACEGEALYTLDGQERRLDKDMLVIADARKPVAVAGIMGGANSEITEKTKVIVLESANFNGPSVRKTALKLAMRTDASGRFEKGLDTENTIPALKRACGLIEQLEAGTVLDGVIDADVSGYKPRRIAVEYEKINALLGADIPARDMDAYLASLGFEVVGGQAAVPSFRADVEGMADLAEEVARMYGYNRIPSSLSSGGAMVGSLTPRQKLKLEIQQMCRHAGYDEMLSYSFISPADYDRINLPESHPLRGGIKLLNPLGEDRSVMRTTMLPSLLTMLAGNAAMRNPDARLFELGLVFTPSGDTLPREEPVVSLGAYGAGFDFFDLKGAVESIVSLFFIKDIRFERLQFGTFHPGRCAALYADGKYAGMLGEIHPDVLEAYDFDSRVWAAELSFDTLFGARGGEPRYTPLPRFPGIRRDISVVCDKDIPSGGLLDCINAACGELLVYCKLFDVYAGEGIPAGKKSVAYTLTFRAANRTLTDEEADAQTALAVGALNGKFGAVLR